MPFSDLAQYHAIVTVTTLPAKIHNQDSRASARSWLESSMNVNREQRHTSADFYTNSIQDGNTASNSMTVANIGNDAAMGQALFMVGNTRFEHGTLRALRSIVDNMRHPAGSTFSDYGDLNVHGRTTSADRRHTNNRLEGNSRADLYNLTFSKGTTSGLSEEEMISVAIAQSLQAPTPYLAPGVMPWSTPALMPRYQSNGPPISALYATASTANSMKTPEFCIHGIEAAVALKSDETPLFIANKRKHLIDSRRKNRVNMSDVDKRKHAKVIDGLSKSYNTNQRSQICEGRTNAGQSRGTTHHGRRS
jgi:hypothetical protein